MFIGFFFGRLNEQNHFKRLRAEEDALSHITVLNIKTLPDNLVPGGALVSGNVVIAVDYFKVVAAGIKTMIGGRLRGYESLVERARREAIIRMMKKADTMGADAIYNIRIEYSSIGAQPANQGGGAELLAYGTAVKYAPNETELA